ncbi:MAG: hypothetical protein WCC26_01035 [Terracidiphilus sp.]
MLRSFANALSVLLLFSTIAVPVFGSPVKNHLLSLIPPNMQIVAGIEDPHNPESHGRLLLVTHNNNLDLADWIALAGVDPDLSIEKVIEVATSSSQGELQEHLLMIDGSFDRELIFRRAIRNGATLAAYKREELLAIRPFSREAGEMTGTRWLAILDDRTVLFGSPFLVAKALDRRTSHSALDPLLLAHLEQLRPDVNSWDVLAMPAAVFRRHFAPGHFFPQWAQALDGVDQLILGIHYGAADRVDFAVHRSAETGSLAQGFFGNARFQLVSSGKEPPLSVTNSAEERGMTTGSIAISSKVFDGWLAEISRGRAAAVSSIRPQ